MAKPTLPTLDFFRGFDAAARHKSFTRAAEELHLTQSALSREIKKLEDEIGTALFERGRRGLELTTAGETLHVVVRNVLRDVAQVVTTIRARGGAHRLTVSTTVPFASLWLVPRLSRFRSSHPEIDVLVSADNRMVDLERTEVDLVVRFTKSQRVPDHAVRLFGERVIPVASPRLVVKSKLRRPEDLARQVLLHLEDPLARTPWLDWTMWLGAAGLPDLEPAGNMRFSQYDQLLQTAVSGQGVALGRRPLIDQFLEERSLVTLFAKRYDVPHAYFAIAAAHARDRPEASAFLTWIVAEASGEEPAAVAARTRRPA